MNELDANSSVKGSVSSPASNSYRTRGRGSSANSISAPSIPIPIYRDKQELEGGLKRDYQEQEAEKYRLIEMIH